MTRSGDDHLDVLLDLSQNYDRNYRRLSELARTQPLKRLLPGLLGQAERITDRVRGLEQRLAPVIAGRGEPGPELAAAVKALCESFDEILILFHVLVDQSGDRAAG